MVPSSVAIISIISTDAVVNVRARNVRRSSRALSVRCSRIWRSTNATRPSAPTRNGTQTGTTSSVAACPMPLSP
jgi:hypothetical protein